MSLASSHPYPSLSPYVGGGCIFSKNVPGEEIQMGKSFHQIVIAEPNNKITTLELKAIYNDYIDSVNYKVGKIFVENSGEIWFPLQRVVYLQNEQRHERYGGLSLLFNDEWTFFDESNGLIKYSDYLYQPINSIFKLDEQRYLLIAEHDLYLMKRNDLFLKKISWFDLFQFATFYSKSESNGNIEFFLDNYGNLLDTNISAKQSNHLKIIKNNNNEFCVVDASGVVKFSNNVVGVNENRDDDKHSIDIRVNGEYLNLSNSNISNFEIYDLLGNLIINGYNSENIYIGHLLKGVYFIKIIKEENFTTQKFIKY